MLFKDSENSVDAIYRAYPKHVEPGPARKAIANAVKVIAKRGAANPAAWLLAQVQRYAAARQTAIDADPAEERFTPACHRWMKNEKYDDDPAAWEVKPNGNHHRNGANNGNGPRALQEHLRL